jgi:hypothetical protein
VGQAARVFGLISEAVWLVTIAGSTLVRYHLEAYDGLLQDRAPEERQPVEETRPGLRCASEPAADCLLTCGNSERGAVRPDQKEMLRAVSDPDRG